MKPFYLLFEFVALYLGLPLLVLYMRDQVITFLLLWAAALIIFFIHPKSTKVGHPLAPDIKMVLGRFALAVPVLTLLTAFYLPEQFLSFPRERPQLWALVMLLYPVLSVWPQEVIYRWFLFERYAPLFGNGWKMIAASALAFGYMHVIFLNWVAVVLTTLGGVIFAVTYCRHRSLWLVCLEHALYGAVIFTLGLGRYFYTGAAWQ